MITRLRNAVKNLVNHVKDRILYPIRDWLVYEVDLAFIDFVILVWLITLTFLLARMTRW